MRNDGVMIDFTTPVNLNNPRPKFDSRSVRLAVWRWRHLFVALAAGMIAISLLQLFAPALEPQIDVLVAARNIPVGFSISEADVTTVSLPLTAAAQWVATDAALVVGRTAITVLPEGKPIWLAQVSSGDLSSQTPPGTVVVAVQLDATTGSMLSPGDRVDLVTLADSSTRILARAALVLPPRAPTGGGSGLFGAAATGGGSTATLFAVTPQDAPSLAVTARLGQVSAILVG